MEPQDDDEYASCIVGVTVASSWNWPYEFSSRYPLSASTRSSTYVPMPSDAAMPSHSSAQVTSLGHAGMMRIVAVPRT